MLNDAEVQGFGVIEGRGLECVVTLGTGFGSALYRDGELMPHLELGQHPIWKQKTYDQYIGIAALRKHGDAKWNRRVQHAIAIVHTLLNYDHLYIGGGNAMRLDFALPTNVTRVSNEAGITGGVALWRPGLERDVQQSTGLTQLASAIASATRIAAAHCRGGNAVRFPRARMRPGLRPRSRLPPFPTRVSPVRSRTGPA